MRTLGLAHALLQPAAAFFHSSAVDVDRLTVHWTQRALTLLPVHRFAGKLVLLGDGIKIPKVRAAHARVKLLHQPGESNTKPPFIMGHSVRSRLLIGGRRGLLLRRAVGGAHP